MIPRIAIIGSNSFSGASFAQYALEQGAEVLGLSRSDEPSAAFLPYRWLMRDQQARFRFVRADLNTDLDALMAALDAFRPSVVINFAAQGMVAQSWERPGDWYRTNVIGNVLLHNRLRHATWLERYVHVGTPEVYGNTSGTIDESTPFNPSTPYAASRAACDLHLRTFLQHYRFPVVWTRAANVYGPGQQLYRIIPRTILFLKLGRKLSLHGGGQSVRSFIHIRDVATATAHIAMSAPIGECYHLSTDRFVSIRDLVQLICDRLGADFSQCVEMAPERPGKDAAYLLDSSKARQSLGWRDQKTLEQGIEETVAWVNQHFNALSRENFDYVHKS